MLSYTSLSGALADERERAVREKARSAWQRRQSGELKFRDATDDDAPALSQSAAAAVATSVPWPSVRLRKVWVASGPSASVTCSKATSVTVAPFSVRRSTVDAGRTFTIDLPSRSVSVITLTAGP